MVKAYLKYEFRNSFGAIAGNQSNIVINHESDIEYTLYDDEKNVACTALVLNNSNFQTQLAAGYEDGDIIVWDLETNTKKMNLNGHKGVITCLSFDQSDSRLFSGSQDTQIIVWDLVGEASIFALHGHKNAITQIAYYELYDGHNKNELILSSSKDGLFKIWDIKLASAVETVSSSSNEIWCFAICKQSDCVFIGTLSDQILVIKLECYRDSETKLQRYQRNMGILKKNSFARPTEIIFDHNLLFILTSEKTIEIFKILTEEQYEKKQKRKMKRIREKGQDMIPEELEQQSTTQSASYLERFVYNTSFHMPKKMRSFALLKKPKNNLVLSFTNNNVEVISFEENQETSYYKYENKSSLQKLGHRSAIRAIHISDNDQLMVSGSGEGIKVWDIETQQPIKSFDSGKYITCIQFLPKNRYLLAGDKEGGLELYDLNNSEKIQEIKAHDASIWSINQHSNPSGYDGYVIVTGSADRKIKFWELAVNKSNQLGLIEAKTLFMSDDVHQVQFTPSGEYYAVSLLDFSVKIFFSDSDKLFLSLYGHKLPALSIDISTDNALLISGSADKNIKIWGMDFGNCHKSIFAHDDSIMQVKFVQNTHYFFSSSRDKTIKYWDGDTYQLVMVFNQCLGEVWALAVSSVGDFFLSGSNDKAMRIWRQTQEQTVVQIEEEERMEKMMIEDYANDKLKDEQENEQKDKAQLEATQVVKKKFENLKYGEEIMAAIDLAEELKEQYMQYEIELIEYQQNKILQKTQKEPEKPDMSKIDNLSIPEFVLRQIMMIKTTELENSLKFLHLPYIEKLLYYINFYVENNINIELATRILFFILQNHENFITNSQKMVRLLVNTQKNLRDRLQKQKDTIGFNLIGIQTIQRELKTQNPDDILTDDIFQTRTEIV